jgi:CheY-like chemotaxis protein
MPPAPAAATPAVLLVGLDDDSRQIFALALEARGFLVIHAESGADALARAREIRAAVIVSGMRSARRTGLSLRAALRSELEPVGTRVLAVCSTRPALAEGSLEPDADRTLLLPVSPRDLVDAVASLAA